ncbi:DASH family cryptochrome [Psychrobacter sp. LV10R520-6]|uniref:DASH family cryptochrome n=1 Tax=Psychrobacter sp. LV10R520-6 TaxID=1415574 RepID=UPI0024C82F44|nr:DASH family cryptochrome [Psychrobacter sp. LV10R520-6]SNT70831.1 deoxyribodipyrimidine photo-lyase [Psychrobacter sp. LV10R520-6]
MSNPPLENPSDSLLAKKVALVLFHNDLRVDDNATLVKAAEIAGGNNRRLMLVYAPFLMDVVEKKTKSQAYHYDNMGHARLQFLAETLADLNESLEQLGNRLLHLQERLPLALDTFAQLCQLIEQQYVTDICVSQTADYNQNQAYDILQRKYPQVRWHMQSTATLFDSLPLDGLPKSFTQFRKKIESDYDLLNAENDIILCQKPKSLPPMPESMISKSGYFFASQNFNERTVAVTDASVGTTYPSPHKFKGGESSGLNHLDTYFDSSSPSTYKTTRNTLDNWADSTKFSAWLANGSLSVNTLLNRLRHYERDTIANESTYWIWFELLWREYFYWYAVTHCQKLFTFQGIAPQSPSTRFDKKLLEQWKNGETPYPIVNACINQLKSTGYMSNRGRQLTASCFIHELGLDWRYGATYFEQHLIDYDVASNWGNWQYLAGVGADPRGCRQFNLKKQTQQYDPNGDFINKWQGKVG